MMALNFTMGALEKAIDAFDAENRRRILAVGGDLPPPLTKAERKQLGALIRVAVMTMLGEIRT